MYTPLLVALLTLARSGGTTLADTVPPVAASGTIVGVVTDSLGKAIVDGNVEVDGIRMAPTDSFGSFVVNVTANRRHTILVRAFGYLPAQFQMLVRPGETRTAQIPLTPVAALLPGVRITVHQENADSYGPGLAGFARRRATLGGSFLNAEDIRQRGFPPLSTLLRGMPGVTVQASINPGGLRESGVKMRGVVTLEDCPVQVYLDGHPTTLAGEDENIDDYINTHELAAVEVYPSGAWAPLQFSSSISATCGVIVLWTVQGLTR